MVAGDRVSGEISRLKREDCSRTKHDREFSKWEILIGACDWEDYSQGKEGAERYRVHNLPKNSGPGVYELGIAVCRTGLGREINKIDPDRIVVVYLGQADNVRTRLQHYGRSGSHLGNLNTVLVGPQKGPGLFEEILSGGYPIVFRWASMQSKVEALRAETRLLNTFDYAWNATTNGTRRPNDVLLKLKKVSSSSSTTNFADIALKLVPFVGPRQVGIRIKSGKICPETDEESPDFFSRVFKFGRSRPRVLDQDKITANDHDNGPIVCGVVLDGRNLICLRPPVEGRKRCLEHTGMRIKASLLTVSSESNESDDSACGFVSADGSSCKSRPIRGNKRCVDHKGKRVFVSENVKCEAFGVVCGVKLGGGLVCTEQPVVGRVRCEEHKGMRVDRLVSDES